MSRNDERDFDSFLSLAERLNLPARLKEEMVRCGEFHTYPAPGLIIGIYMVEYARELLSVQPGEKIYAVCETPKCLPDALQVILHCTCGNNRLRIIRAGRFAFTINRGSDEAFAQGIRIYVDQEKLKSWPTLLAWFTHDTCFDKHAMGDRLFEEILTAGRQILSSERVRVPVHKKVWWSTKICESCGQMVPSTFMAGGVCAACSAEKYYELE
jgi:formylmethanofuran dehydrogenase subunit E